MYTACFSGSRIFDSAVRCSALFLALYAAAIQGVITYSFAADNGAMPVAGNIAFNIPSQPLASALEIYARVARREVLYDSAVAEGRRSSEVDGIYTPEVALQILIAGTGLWAEFKDVNFFVVGLAARKEMPDRLSAGGQSAEQIRYYGRLQASLRTAFCRAKVLPDDSRVATRLWVGQSGQVLQVKTLASTGNDALDQQVDAALRGLRLGGPPPVGFAQPITIVIVPNAPDFRQDCSDGRSQPVRAGP